MKERAAFHGLPCYSASGGRFAGAVSHADSKSARRRDLAAFSAGILVSGKAMRGLSRHHEAIRVDEFGEPEVMRLIELAEPKVADKQILVRIKAAGVNPWRLTFAAATTLGSRNCLIHREAMARNRQRDWEHARYGPAWATCFSLRLDFGNLCGICGLCTGAGAPAARERDILSGSSRNSVCDGISSPCFSGVEFERGSRSSCTAQAAVGTAARPAAARTAELRVLGTAGSAEVADWSVSSGRTKFLTMQILVIARRSLMPRWPRGRLHPGNARNINLPKIFDCSPHTDEWS